MPDRPVVSFWPVGGGSAVLVPSYRNVSFDDVELVPDGVVTVTCTFPGAPGGVTVTILVGDRAVTVTVVAPNCTELARLKLAPSTTTGVPPDVGPLSGVTLETTGAGTDPAGTDLKIHAAPARK
jgi:hypothetical protein